MRSMSRKRILINSCTAKAWGLQSLTSLDTRYFSQRLRYNSKNIGEFRRNAFSSNVIIIISTAVSLLCSLGEIVHVVP